MDQKVSKRFGKLDKKTEALEERLSKLEKERKGACGTPKAAAKPGKAVALAFLVARRSMQLSPCNRID